MRMPSIVSSLRVSLLLLATPTKRKERSGRDRTRDSPSSRKACCQTGNVEDSNTSCMPSVPRTVLIQRVRFGNGNGRILEDMGFELSSSRSDYDVLMNSQLNNAWVWKGSANLPQGTVGRNQ